MNIESIREYCLSLPLATEAFPFDERTLVFRILGKIFACVDLERPEWVTMKCNADYALELREEHPEIEGAWHWNKKYWNQVNLYGTLEDDFIQSLLRHSYSEVFIFSSMPPIIGVVPLTLLASGSIDFV